MPEHSKGTLTEEAILDALRGVDDPELHQDLVSLGMVKNIHVEDGKVTFNIELTTPACPLREQIRRDAQQAVEALPGVVQVDVELTAKVRSDQQRRDMLQQPVRNIVAIASGKGGVGKTTVAVNISVALARAGAKVGLMDADIYGPNVPTMMGVNQRPSLENNRMIPLEAFGVKIISIGFLVPPGQPLIWRGPMLHSAIRQFISDVAWGELDYLIVDLPPGTGDAQLSLSQSVPLSGGLIVTLPQKVSLEDAQRGLEMFRTMQVPILGVVENMSYLELPDGTQMDVFGQGGGESLAKQSGVPFIGSIPIDPAVREGGDQGVPVIISKPESPVAKALTSIAEHLAAQLSIQAHQQSKPASIQFTE